jgi:dihydrofolate synthase/folylpolyglutamate synthase
MTTAPLNEWLARLETMHPSSIDLGLARVASVARRLDLLPVTVPVITVAGTNGKGSTVAVLEKVLQRDGMTTGVYTSPHLLRFNERIRVGGIEVSDEEIVAAFEAVDERRGGTSLTYFEFATLAALLLFRWNTVQVLVLEVGLGGRLDAVNIVDASIAVITSIGLDHQEWLGNDLGSIAREKAGIMRTGIPVVVGDPDPPAELLEHARELGVEPFVRLGSEFGYQPGAESWSGVLRRADGSIRHLSAMPNTPLHPANVCAALQAALLLGSELSDEELTMALRAARPRGRCERVDIAGRAYFIDVAHNPAAVANLVEKIASTHCKGKTYCLFSAMADKDLAGMVMAAEGCFSAWYVAGQPDNPRAASGEEVAKILHSTGQHAVSLHINPEQAWHCARAVMEPGDRLVVFGSFFTVATVLPLLDRECGRDEG